MTRDDIIRMARETGFESNSLGMTYTSGSLLDLLERFAELVAAAERERLEATAWGASQKWIDRAIESEREACAVIAFNAETYLEAAAAIRARGQV